MPSRRSFLQTSCGASVLAILSACNSEWPGEFATVKVTPSGSSVDFDVSQAAYAALATVGGMVGVDSGSLQLLLIRTAADKVAAFSRLCPHAQEDMAPDKQGAYDAPTSTLSCTKHNSKFDATGSCTSGPAKGKALKAYPVTFDAATGKGSISLGQALEFNLNDPQFSVLSKIGGMIGIDSGSTQLLLIRTATKAVSAYSRLCPHAQEDMGPDQQGSYDAPTSTLTCNKHNSKFDATGTCTSGPAKGKKLKTYAVTFDNLTGKGSVSV